MPGYYTQSFRVDPERLLRYHTIDVIRKLRSARTIPVMRTSIRFLLQRMDRQLQRVHAYSQG